MQQWHSRSNIVASNVKGSRISTDVSSEMSLRLPVLTDKHTTHGTRMDIVSYIQCQRVWAVMGKRYAPSVMGKAKYIIHTSKTTNNAPSAKEAEDASIAKVQEAKQ